jgi:hypothetical protein
MFDKTMFNLAAMHIKFKMVTWGGVWPMTYRFAGREPTCLWTRATPLQTLLVAT